MANAGEGRASVSGRQTRGRGRTSLERMGFVVLLVAVLLAAAASPFAIASLAGSLKHPEAANVFHLAVPSPNAATSTALNIRLTAIDESAQTVTLALTGDRRCDADCGAGQVLQVFSVRANPQGADGAPPSTDVAVPTDGEFDSSVTLPVSGGLGAYPFDHYRLLLGLGLAEKTADGQTVSLSPRAARSQLDVSLDEKLPRLDLATPKDLSSHPRFVGAQMAVLATVDLSRPFYLQALTVFIIVFIAIAGVYSVLTRAFKEVIATVGVVVLGVWGVRTLLVGGYPPDSTAVDLILTLLILLLLVVLALRGLALMWAQVNTESGAADRGAAVPRATETFEDTDSGLEVFSEIA